MVYLSESEGTLVFLLHWSQTFFYWRFLICWFRNFKDFYWILICCFIKFQPLIVIYKRGNFVYHHWGRIYIFRPLSYPFRSLYIYVQHPCAASVPSQFKLSCLLVKKARLHFLRFCTSWFSLYRETSYLIYLQRSSCIKSSKN